MEAQQVVPAEEEASEARMSLWACRACGARYEIVVSGAKPSRACVCGFSFFDEVEATPARPINALQGEANKDRALARVGEAMDPKWRAQALFAVQIVARQQAELTTDDVWKFLPPTRENRGMGAVMTQAQKEEWIEWTDRTVRSARPGCNRRPVRVWRSKLFFEARGPAP